MDLGFRKLDPNWQQIAASLRKEQLYVKMPIAKARAVCMVWQIVSQTITGSPEHIARLNEAFNLLEEETVGSQTYGIKSVFYMVSVDQCERDIEALASFVEEDASGVLRSLKEALEAGLRSNPEVDWIARVGGPPAHPFEALQRESIPVDDLSLDDFFTEVPIV